MEPSLQKFIDELPPPPKTNPAIQASNGDMVTLVKMNKFGHLVVYKDEHGWTIVKDHELWYRYPTFLHYIYYTAKRRILHGR
jgi:hypothetical protein